MSFLRVAGLSAWDYKETIFNCIKNQGFPWCLLGRGRHPETLGKDAGILSEIDGKLIEIHAWKSDAKESVEASEVSSKREPRIVEQQKKNEARKTSKKEVLTSGIHVSKEQQFGTDKGGLWGSGFHPLRRKKINKEGNMQIEAGALQGQHACRAQAARGRIFLTC